MRDTSTFRPNAPIRWVTGIAVLTMTCHLLTYLAGCAGKSTGEVQGSVRMDRSDCRPREARVQSDVRHHIEVSEHRVATASNLLVRRTNDGWLCFDISDPVAPRTYVVDSVGGISALPGGVRTTTEK